MSYNQGGQAYGQYNPYGQAGNPYSDQETPYSQGGHGNQASYGQRPQPVPQGSSYYPTNDEEQGGRGYEMSNMNGNDPNRMLNECRAIDRSIDQLEGDLQQLDTVQKRHVDDIDPNSPLRRQVDDLSNNTMNKYRGLTDRVKRLKQDPQSGNPRNAPQVGKVDRRLRGMINRYQQQDSKYRKDLQDRIAREYRIVRPDASDAEIREATEDTNQQVFSQALINSDRRGQAQSIATSVNHRHQAIQKIESDMVILAQLFQDLETAVVQQEPAVTQIEQRGEEVTDHVAKANTELDGAVKKARAARRKKWYCVGIVALIIIIIVIVVVVVVEVTKN